MREWIERLWHEVHLLLTQPTDQLGRAQRSLRYTINLCRYCYYELLHDQASQMAAALTYRTIFSLVPLLVLSLLVFRGFYNLDDAQSRLQDLIFTYGNLSALTMPDDSANAGGTGGTGGTEGTANAASAAGTTGAVGAAAPPAHGHATPPHPAPEPVPVPEGPAVPPPTSTTAASSANAPTKELEITPPPPTVSTSEHKAIVKYEVDKKIKEFTSAIWKMEFKSIGIIGLVVLIYSGIALIVTVEQSFNQIYNAPEGRRWVQRVAVYWGVVTLGPVLLMVSIYAAGALVGVVKHVFGVEITDASGTVIGESLGFIGGLLNFFSTLTAPAASWLFLFLLYAWLPNTKVQLRAAAVGSFVAAMLWEIGKWGFKLYVKKAVLSYSAIYGALGLVPLFLLWIYVTWIIVLFGLELTYTLQGMKGEKLKAVTRMRERQMMIDPQWIIPVAACIGREFVSGAIITVDEISRRLKISTRMVAQLCEHLEKEHLVHRVSPKGDGDAGYTLAKPAEQIRVRELLELAHTLTGSQGGSAPTDDTAAFLERLRRAQLDTADELTLAALVPTNDPAPSPALLPPAPTPAKPTLAV